MKKKSFVKKVASKLQVHRETLRALEQKRLGEVQGGVSYTGCGWTNGPTRCSNLC